MKKLLAVILATAILVSLSIAQAEGPFEAYPSYYADAATGEFSARANEADALLSRFWTEGGKYPGNAVAFFIEISGNANTGVLIPQIKVYFMQGKEPLNIRALSIIADGERYDYAVNAGSETLGKRAAETATAIIADAEALASLTAIAGAETIKLRLYGDDIYETEISGELTGERQKLEYASLASFASGLKLTAGMEKYNRWDMNGDKAAFYSSLAPDGEFSDVILGDKTEAAKMAQEALISAGFLSGEPARAFDSDARSAALRAQKYLGLIETGAFDARLSAALSNPRAEKTSEEIQATRLGDALLMVNRYWFAKAVSPSNSASPDSARAVANLSNRLVISDGYVKNASASEMRMFTQLEAQFVYAGEYAYQASVLVEADEGARFDTSLIPLAESRLVLCAEIPASIAGLDGWTLVITSGGEKIEYALSGGLADAS